MLLELDLRIDKKKKLRESNKPIMFNYNIQVVSRPKRKMWITIKFSLMAGRKSARLIDATRREKLRKVITKEIGERGGWSRVFFG